MDKVNHPKHYTSHPSGIECIDIVENYDFCIGNAIKYLFRHDEKNNPIEDLKKSSWYVRRYIKIHKDDKTTKYILFNKKEKSKIKNLCNKYCASESNPIIREAVKLLILLPFSETVFSDLRKSVLYIQQQIHILEDDKK